MKSGLRIIMTSGRMQHTEIQKKKETKNEKQTEGR
jgi:hypothetical protein